MIGGGDCDKKGLPAMVFWASKWHTSSDLNKTRYIYGQYGAPSFAKFLSKTATRWQRNRRRPPFLSEACSGYARTQTRGNYPAKIGLKVAETTFYYSPKGFWNNVNGNCGTGAAILPGLVAGNSICLHLFEQMGRHRQ